nr:protein odd-skipped-related 2-like [Procambarus clarkii]
MTSHNAMDLCGCCSNGRCNIGPDSPLSLLPRESWRLDWESEDLPGAPAAPPAVAPRGGSSVTGLTVGAIAVVEGGRVCRRTRREGGRSYVCRVCERRFPRAYLLLVHERSHTPFACPVCGRTFRRSEHLRVHRETHGNKRPA